MSLANDSHLVTPGASGTPVATHTVAGKEHQVMMLADDSGHIQGSLPTYFYCTPPIAAGANKLMFDMFNASAMVMDVRGIWCVVKSDVAVTGAVSARIDLFRTSAVGTGGNAATLDGAAADPSGGNITKFDELNGSVPAQLTARVAPTGGATLSRWLFPVFAFSEETGPGAQLMQFQNWMPMFSFGQKLVVRNNTGLLVRQGSVASVNSYAFLVAFTLE